MQVKFKENTKTFQAAALSEQKLYQGGKPVGWLLALSISEGLSSTELDALLTAESMSEISVISGGEETARLTGYTSVSSCVVRYTDEKTVTELQLTKKYSNTEEA